MKPATPPPLDGIHAILYAFFDRAGRLDRQAMRRQVEVCLAVGVHGVCALGLTTEVAKLSTCERHTVMDWVSEDVGGRVPVGFTIFGPTVEAQQAEARQAAKAGGDWVIHQPPPKDLVPNEAALVDFFSAVIASHNLPAAIQNAPAYLGVGLSPGGILALRQQARRFCILKGEGPAVEIAHIAATLDPEVVIFNGRGGLELCDNMRAGCAGVIVAPDVIDRLVASYGAMLEGQPEQAEALYREALPAIVFVMHSIDSLTVYGKRLTAWRMGLVDVYDRDPSLAVSAFGLDVTSRFAQALGPFGQRPFFTRPNPS